MKRLLLGWAALLWALAYGPLAPAQDFADPPPPVNTLRISPDLAEIVKLVKSGAAEDQVIAAIKAHPRLYSLTSEDVRNLRKLGVNSRQISAMRAHDKELLKVWKRGAAEASGKGEELPRLSPPKMQGGNPATDLGQPMRQDAPLIMLRPPAAATNSPPSKYVRPWTSTTIVEQAPPPPQLEVAPPSPGPDYLWVPGNWMWRDGTWVWDSGKWLRRPSPTAVWMNGEWQPHARGWIWVPGEWR